MEKQVVLKVSAKSNPHKVAGAITNTIKNNQQVEIHVIGAGAVNQATKSIAIARGFVSATGLDLVCTPSFIDIGAITGIRIVVEPKKICKKAC